MSDDSIAVKRIWKPLLRRLPFFSGRGGFVAETLTISTGTFISQAILFLVSPVLTRLYSPEDFGAFSIFSFLVSIPSVLACWCLEPAVILPESDDEALSILATSVAATLVTGSAVLATAVLLNGRLGAFFRVPQISPWLWISSLYVWSIGLFQGLTYWNTRKRMFRAQSLSRVGQSVAASIPQTAAGLFHPSVGGLIGGYVAGQVVGSAILAGSLTCSQWGKVLELFRVERFMQVLKRYKAFPLFSSWGTLMNITSFQIVPVLFSRLFTAAEAGYYFLGFRILSAPISLVAVAIGQVFFQRTGAQPAQIPLWVAKILARMILLLTLPTVGLFLFAEPLFALVFGGKWAMTGRYIQSLTPLFFLQFLTSPLSFILIVREKQNVVAGIQFLLLFSTVLSISLGGTATGDALKTVRMYAAAQSLVYALYLTVVLRHASVGVRAILGEMREALRPLAKFMRIS